MIKCFREMKLRAGIWSAAVLLLIGSGCGRGFRTPHWCVGQWVRYSVTSSDKTWQLEYALVGEEKDGESQLFWLETRRFDGKDTLFVKWLVPAGLNGPAKRVLVGKGTSANVMVDGPGLPREAERGRSSGDQSLAVLESIETPAGPFLSERYAKPSGLVWLSSKVPIFGVVRSKGDEGELMLVAYGLKGATSKLTEAPNMTTIP